MADKKSVNLLPEYLKSDKNSKFLSSTIDQLIQTPQLERIDGYVGSVLTPNFDPKKDFYLKEGSYLRTNYPLEPALVFKDPYAGVTDVVAFDDIVNEITIQGGKTKNLDRLFRSKFYSYDPLIDWDKLVNYTEYYWLPIGPDPVLISGSTFNIEDDIIGQASYTMENGYDLTNGLRISFSDDVIPSSYRGKEYIVEGVGSSIKLIDFSLLVANEALARVFNETWDSDDFDDFPFDGDARLPLDPAYITINKASRDLNPWSRYNRWFHKDVIRITAEINGQVPVYPNDLKAKRPIIEFKPNIQLYNFGKRGIKNVDLIDTDTLDAFGSVNGTFGYYVDGKLLEQGQRVIFNADINDDVRGKIYLVTYDVSGSSPILQLVEADDSEPNDLDATSINYGIQNSGTNWYFDNELRKWFKGQQCTSVNQPPLFDLFDNDGLSYSRSSLITDFIGSKIFGYDVGTGSADPVLGFPLKYQNSIGTGSYLFKNYFMTDIVTVTVDNVSSQISTGVTLLRVNNDNGSSTFTNVWKTTVDYQIPIIENKVIEASTSSVVVTCLNKPYDVTLSIDAYVNEAKVSASTTIDDVITVQFDTTLNVDDLVTLKIRTSQTPNENGYYETPLGLTNNPLNGPISDMALSELSDHVYTMVQRKSEFEGNFPGVSNLRDLTDYTKYGTRLIVNANPIAFAQTFLGKKDHNVVDALSLAAVQYNQFKMSFLKALNTVNEQVSPVNALDYILATINVSKDEKSLYYTSDMLGYGQDKIVKEYTVSPLVATQYPIGTDFSLSKLSFKSVLVYLNGVQLVEGPGYSFNEYDDSISIYETLTPGDLISIHRYPDTLGSFVPPTPSKLGLYPKFKPEITTDESYAEGPVTVIVGHDGSVMKAYGDYRDDIILEFEKRVYNNIKVEYNSKIFDINSVLPGAFRNTKYSNKEVNDILKKDFLRWVGMYNIDATINTSFDAGNSLTWNFKGGYDSLLGTETFGTWRAVFRQFYDTDRPNTHPWEMLGFFEKPLWWESDYGLAPYTSSNTLLWNDLEAGYVRGTGETLTDYARPGLSEIIPVDVGGNLRLPDEFLVYNLSYTNQKANWEFGDWSPAETAWRRSSFWPFAINAAAALLDPCTYTSHNYDLSRTSINALGQVTYLEDDLYLNPNKLVIETEDGAQTAGFGVYVYESGKQKNLNYLDVLRQDLTYLNFNLFHKLGGFASKEKLQVYIDSIDPVSSAPGAVLPPEDYDLILNISNPIKSVAASGIVVQKSNGNFIVKGYDKVNPYFEILRPIKTGASGGVTVGGVSESFTEWSGQVNNGNSGLNSVDTTSAENTTTRYYKQGQLVRYNNKYYRVKVGHVAQQKFDPSLFYQLPSLPMVGGATAELPARYETTVTQIPYGSEFSTIQEVYDLILGYGAFLESQGFKFDYYNTDLDQVMDWKFSGKEFLYWTTQNWAENNLITLSPFANSLSYSFNNSTVDNISTGKYEYSLLKADGKSFPIDKFKLSREDGICVVETVDTEEGIFFIRLNSVQKEHGMVFNNATMFNDTMYDIETGYKQRRIRLSGFRTLNWNGDLSSPGFVYDDVAISDWAAFKTYLPGKVVRFNGAYYESSEKISGDATFDFSKWVKLNEKPIPELLPNFDYKINQFEDFYSLDIDNFDQAQQQLAQHLVGYTPRTYLNDIFSNATAQYKFYQGFIKEKGTRNAIDKISKAGKFVRKGSIDFKEEWAFRVGNYGAYETYNEIEFALEEGSYLENPYIVKFVDQVPSDTSGIVNYTSSTNMLISPEDYNPLMTFNTSASDFVNNNLELTTAGYARLDDITVTAYNKNSLLDIANNTLINNGDTVWLGFLENGDWTIYRYARQEAKISGVFVSAPAEEITFVTNLHHNLVEGDIVSVVRFNEQVNGVYIVKSVPELNQFTVASKLSTITNDDLVSYGALFKFETARYKNFKELSEAKGLLTLDAGSKFWVDNDNDSRWAVYEKTKNYNTGTVYRGVDAPAGKRLGYTVFTTEDAPVVMVAAPGWSLPTSTDVGRITVYDKVETALDRQFEYTLNSNNLTYAETNTATQFGYSLSYDAGKSLYFAGAPAASNIRRDTAPANTVVLSTGTGTAQVYEQEGVVKISSKDARFVEETTVVVLAHPNALTSSNAVHARFGHSIYTNQIDATTSTLLLVGAPGDSYYTGGRGQVYAYRVSTSTSTSTVSVVENPSSSIVVGYGGSVKEVVLSASSSTVSASTVTVVFSAPQLSGGIRATGVAVKTGNTVTSVLITNGGCGYTSAPSIVFNAATGTTGTGVTVISVQPETLTSGSRFGHKIAGNSTGTIIAISAPEHVVDDNLTGIVQIFDENLYFLQSITSPFDTDSRFGDDLVVSDTGKYLLVSSVNSKEAGEPYGKVAVYVLGADNRYSLHQIITNPLQSDDLRFGYSMSMSKDENTLIISALGKNRSRIMHFDNTTRPNETTFDGGTTRFNSPVPDAGTVYLYNNLGEYFVQADEIVDPTNNVGSRFGTSVIATNDILYVGAPSYVSLGIDAITTSSVTSINVEDSLTFEISSPDVVPGVKPIVSIVYDYNDDGLTKTVSGFDILSAGTGYLYAPSAYLADSLGNTVTTVVATLSVDESAVIRYQKIDTDAISWKLSRFQPDTVNVDEIKRVALIDSFKEEIIDYLDVVDPLKGKIVGIADQELKYKSAFDPAIYTIGLAISTVDTEASWIDDHVGELWWDLSTAKYVWYEQGDEIFRKNNWGRLFPGANIDVYEWVKSDLLPSEWAAQADTNEGLTKGISGQPKYPDNSIVSVKQIFNNVTGAFENVYYFWVKNKVTVPNVKNRRISGYQVARYIADPVASGAKFAEILSPNAVAFGNIQDTLVGKRINANIVIDTNDLNIPRHTEWLLLEENSANSEPTELLNKKLFDSLLGHDEFGNLVPAAELTSRNRYGIGIRPQQTLFKDRLAALRNIVEYANSVLIDQRIVGNFNFDNLTKQEEIPDVFSREYDYVVEDLFELENIIDTTGFKRAKMICYVSNGKISSVTVTDPGYGYANPPKVTIVGNNQTAEIQTEIDSLGRVINAVITKPGSGFETAPLVEIREHSVIVQVNEDYGNRWTKHVYDYVSKLWVRTKTQTFNASLYWEYVDWSADDFNPYKDYAAVISDRYELTQLSDITEGEYVKINNAGNGTYVILKKLADGMMGNFAYAYDVIFSELGTIQILDSLWRYSDSNWAYDDATLEETLYDQVPDLELLYILTALKEDIFIGDNKVYWNSLFFKAVKYALTEQKLLDWAFKTSFITVNNTVGELDQRPVYKLDNERAFESYIYEVKPYHTKIRSYTASYTSQENSNLFITDFDLPSYFNTLTQEYATVGLGDDKLTEQPWKSWSDNYRYTIDEIRVAQGGAGYTQRPVVEITTATGDIGYGLTAEAYIRNGEVFKIEVTSPGYDYVIPPTIRIAGGGTRVTTTATASAILGNSPVRRNTVGIRFDRVKAEEEIGETKVVDEFICPGNTDKFELTWLADTDKINILPLLDGKLVYSTDYTIEYYTTDNKGYNQTKSRFVFLKTIPREGQVFRITYNKNVNLYTAVDRITKLYEPKDTMPGIELPLLMQGAEFPRAQVQGLTFDYSSPFNDSGETWYNNVWEDMVNYYASARINTTATVGDTVLYLNTTTGISSGQEITVLDSPVKRVRDGTTVVSVDPTASSITISAPSYRIRRMRADGTSTTATIEVHTSEPFTGNIRAGDIAIVTGVDHGTVTGFNGQYIVHEILDNERFSVTATTVLSTTTVGVYTTASRVDISSILTTIESDVLYKTISEVTQGTSTYVVKTGLLSSDIYRIDVLLDGVTPPEGDPEGSFPLAEYYHMSVDSAGQTIVTFYQLGLLNVYDIDIRLYTGPVIEFWKFDQDAAGLDNAIEGGTWGTQSNFISALGVNPEDIIVDGSSFLNSDYGYGPEECVPGHVMDALGVNVYTKAEKSYALAITNVLPLPGGNQITRHRIGSFFGEVAGILVHCDGVIFNRVLDTNFYAENQFFIDGDEMIVAGRAKPGRLSYTIMQLGGNDELDTNVISVTDVTEALCDSLLNIDDVQRAYVLVNGYEIDLIPGDPEFFGAIGYKLTNVGKKNNRACVKVYNLPPGTHTIEAWFFQTPYTTFNRVNNQTIIVDTPAQDTFILDMPPSDIEPQTIHALVEQSFPTDPTRRKVLTPPWVSYYRVDNDQRVFDIDNRNSRDPNTYTLDTVRVYANGMELRPGFDFLVDEANSQIVLTDSLIDNGSALAVMGLIEYEYIIIGGVLHLATPIENQNLRVTTFTNHDDMGMRSERFKGTAARRYTLTRPTTNDDFVWVYVNGLPLTARYDYEILEDFRTIQLSEWYSLTLEDTVLIVSIDPPEYGDTILGFRIFNDAFGRYHYKRLADFHSTTLLRELKADDTEIWVADSSKIVPPNPKQNKPGIILVDSERIEFFIKEGNVLKQLRRSTLGTGPAFLSEAGTKVIDQSPQNTIPYSDSTHIQTTTATNTTTYYIDTGTITLSTATHAVDQVVVYYGGRQLRKVSVDLHDKTKSFDTTATSIVTLPPEFTINTSTNVLTLNISNGITSGTNITIVQRTGRLWTGTESLLTSDVIQAKFLRDRQAELPDIYYYGGDPVLLDSGYIPITDDNDEPLEGY